jgi:hypothetical protein
MPAKTGQPGDLHHFAGFFHGFVPCYLGLRDRPRLRLRMPARDFTVGFDVPADLSSYANADIAFAHFREAHHAFAAVGLVGEVLFTVADRIQILGKVAVPFHGIHG